VKAEPEPAGPDKYARHGSILSEETTIKKNVEPGTSNSNGPIFESVYHRIKVVECDPPQDEDSAARATSST
jgi:hypothetical protein